MRTAVFLLAALPLAAPFACGGGDASSGPTDAGVETGTRPIHPDAGPVDTGPDVDHGAPSDVYPAPHPALPKIKSTGGKVLATPKIVPVFYANDTARDQLETYAQQLVGSPYWTAATSEYGVGALTLGTTIVISDPAPTETNDGRIALWLTQMLDGTHADWGTPDENAIYTLFYGTETAMPGACTTFGGYHSDVEVGGKKIAYAVIPRCPGGIAETAFTTSHEWIEAATDPIALDQTRGYFLPDDDHLAWLVFPGSELGDICDLDTSTYAYAANVTLPAQAGWSNVAAAASHDPCVPRRPGEAYFDSVPVLPDTVTISFDYDFGKGFSAPTRGVKIPVGQSRTIEVDLFSDAPTSGPWSIRAEEAHAFGGASTSGTLGFTFDRDGGVNGEKVYLTIESLAKIPGGGTPFVIWSTLNKARHAYVGYVSN